ncbi:MAG: hypothetical protein ABI318_06865, partial [Chthoniobacteraceae bacterium]
SHPVEPASAPAPNDALIPEIRGAVAEAEAAVATDQSPVTSHQSHSAEPASAPAPDDAPIPAMHAAVAETEVAVATDQSPVTSHPSHPAEPASAPVILAPLVMELAHGTPPPVFLVPVGFTPPVLPTWKDAAPAAETNESHATG